MNGLPKQLITTALVVATLLAAVADGATLSGIVTRRPAATAKQPTVSRYAGRSLASTSKSDNVSCQCNPGLFSVVYLTGDSLPEPDLPDSTPVMAQVETRFEPSVMAVAVGTSVGFPNLDPYFHNVFSYSKTKRFDLGRYPQGETKVVTFDRPGLVQIFCEIHYSMRAYVHVLATPFFAVSDDNGKFSIRGIEPGRYTVNVWQENLPLLTREIVIESDSLHIELD